MQLLVFVPQIAGTCFVPGRKPTKFHQPSAQHVGKNTKLRQSQCSMLRWHDVAYSLQIKKIVPIVEIFLDTTGFQGLPAFLSNAMVQDLEFHCSVLVAGDKIMFMLILGGAIQPPSVRYRLHAVQVIRIAIDTNAIQQIGAASVIFTVAVRDVIHDQTSLGFAGSIRLAATKGVQKRVQDGDRGCATCAYQAVRRTQKQRFGIDATTLPHQPDPLPHLLPRY
mmetsp:Transcript_65106/g.153222  ORF Transcript_65106/g.153222 Transcript_65106/m.153222 type:complete len:222 (+) Transcript_65106:546-1211(+)